LTGGDLWERDSEVTALGAAFDAAASGIGRLVLVEGPAGIGKSRLLAVARSLATERQLPVLAARGLELEREVPFGLARQLFVPSLLRASDAQKASLLAGPAALAETLLDGSQADAQFGEGQAGALVEGLHWLAASLAQAQADQASPARLAVVVDDAQWADRPSLRFLAHMARQSDDTGFCVVAAVRTGEPGGSHDLLGRLRAQPGCVRLRPAVLTEAAVSNLIRAHHFPDATDAFCQSCAHVSGGNPFLLKELLAVLRADAVLPTDEAAHRVGRLLPESVMEAVVVNLTRLPETAVRLAGAVAVFGQAPVPLAAELAGLGIAEAEQAADLLAAADLILPAEPLAFVHPLIGSAVLADLGPFRRARAHRRAAALLDREGADAAAVAGHLIETRPEGEAWASEALRAAGRDALVHGEPQVAVRLLRRALEERPPPDYRDAILIELAHAEAADDSPDAVSRLEQVLNHVRDRRTRADAYNQLARLLFFKGEIAESAAAAERGLAEIDPGDELAAHLLSAQLTAATFVPALRAGLTDQLQAYLPDARSGRPPRDPMVCAHVSARMAIAGDPAALVLPIAEAAFGRHPLVDDRAHGIVLGFPVVALVIIDELDRAADVLERALRSGRARTSLITQTVAHHWSSVVAYRRGDLVQAHAHAQHALTACRTGDWNLYGPWITANLAQIYLEWGDTEAARAVLDVDSDDATDPVGRSLRLEARGCLASALNQPARALAHFTAAGATADALGLVSPGFLPWRSRAGQAAILAGHGEQAAGLIADELALARRTGNRRAAGIALRASGLIAEGDDIIALLSDSVKTLEASSGRLELARSLTELGAALRRGGQRSAARPVLRRALDIATSCGAQVLTEHTRTELLATGSRPRRARLSGIESLTPAERRVAELAGHGRTNTEIAHVLFVTTKTVEWHLANAFRKLGITSRRDLAAALPGEGPS
jgi:DNA-binding CsgD family transcriptional regulator/predicted negative regulator of RcsB-dependent stress response